MHGFGPSILHQLPREGAGATARDVQAALEARLCKAPSIDTIRNHLYELRRLDLVYSERRGREIRYWRLVDSVLDALPAGVGV